MATLILTSSVGSGKSQKGIPHNKPEDVIKIRNRLVELGYVWISGITLGTEAEFIRVIRLFQSIIKGSGKLDKGDGRIDLGGETHRWLAAKNAPGWVKLFGQTGYGWRSTADFKVDNGGYTTTWMEERIRWAGFEYMTKAFLGGISDAPPLWIRECSPAKGGDASGHKSHETGLDVDIRLPLLPPKTNDWDMLGPSTYTDWFHFDAAVAQLKAVKWCMAPKYVFFNDPRCISQKLCTSEPNHGNHYHIRIAPPVRIEGTYT